MNHPYHTETELIRRAVRAKICTRCYQCRRGEFSLAADVARSCEPQCTVFINSAAMYAAVAEDLPVLADADLAVEQIVCETCHIRPTSGEFCAEFASRACPLSRYGRDVIDLLQRMRDRHRQSTPTVSRV
jgi:hypothetical protein